MKTLNSLLKEIKEKDQKLFAKIEKQIQKQAESVGVQLAKTEHPVKPPVNP